MELYVLEGLSHDIVFGMDYLTRYNPTVDFATRELLLRDGTRVAACKPVSDDTAGVELCSLQHARKLLQHDVTDAFFCTLRVSMEDNAPHKT